MSAGHRWLLALSVAIVITGLAGIATLQPSRHHPSEAAAQPDHAPGAVPGRAPDSNALAALVLAPRDLGGGYRVSDDSATGLLDSAPCLAGLGASGVQAGRAATALIGPAPGGVPTVTEVLASYPASAAALVFGSVNATMRSCPTFAATLGGARLVVPLSAAVMAPVGNASRAYEGHFRLGGQEEQLDVAIVLEGQVVMGLVYVDRVPGLGDLGSTVRAAVAKLV